MINRTRRLSKRGGNPRFSRRCCSGVVRGRRPRLYFSNKKRLYFRSLRENLDRLPIIQPQPLPECKHLKLSPKNRFKRSVFCCFCFCFVLLCFFSVHTVFLYGSCHADVQIYKQYSGHNHAEFRLCSALDLYSGIHLHQPKRQKLHIKSLISRLVLVD